MKENQLTSLRQILEVDDHFGTACLLDVPNQHLKSRWQSKSRRRHVIFEANDGARVMINRLRVAKATAKDQREREQQTEFSHLQI